MKKSAVQVLSAVAGASVLLAGCAPQEAAAPAPQQTAPAAQAEAAAPSAFENAVISARETAAYDKLANVTGEFTFNQDTLTPADEVFSLFGTAATALCAKPGFAFEKTSGEDYYVNVGGTIKKAYSLNLSAIADMEPTTRTLACSCGHGPAVANAQVTGVKLADVLSLAELEEGTDTVTVRDAEGYGLPIPLSVALEKGAMLVYQVNGEKLAQGAGAPLQLWMPEAAAKYFTRQVTEIELSASNGTTLLPETPGVKVSIVNRADRNTFRVGDRISFEGYADDCGDPIAAVEFSMDGGESWTRCETAGATADRWVCWKFAFDAEAAGAFKLDVRARTASGTISPLASSVIFAVE